MAADIDVPGDELRRAQDTLTFVHDFIELDTATFDLDAAFGAELAAGSAGEFESRWADGREQLRKQVKEVGDAIGSILDAFAKTDSDAAASLDQAQG